MKCSVRAGLQCLSRSSRIALFRMQCAYIWCGRNDARSAAPLTCTRPVLRMRSKNARRRSYPITGNPLPSASLAYRALLRGPKAIPAAGSPPKETDRCPPALVEKRKSHRIATVTRSGSGKAPDTRFSCIACCHEAEVKTLSTRILSYYLLVWANFRPRTRTDKNFEDQALHCNKWSGRLPPGCAAKHESLS